MKKLFVLLSLILCFSGALSAKLITHFEFENSLEDSVGDNDGTFTSSGSSIYNTGRNGKALVFNGTSDYMEFGKGDFDPRYSGHYSISMWVLSTEQASTSNNNAYIGKHDDSGNAIILFGYFNNQLYFRINNAYTYISNAGNEPENLWIHYAVSAIEQNNGTTSVVIYKSGSQIWSGTLNAVAGDFEEDYKPWVLGTNWTSLSSKSDFLKGRMDNVRIYDWNITADEAKEIYYKELPSLHLKMDDSFKSSVGSITGTAGGGTAFKQGMENRAAYFDGVDDYVKFGSGTTDPRSSGTTTRKYTISIWVKSDEAASSSNNNAYIVKQTDTNADVFRFGYWNNKLILKIGSSSADVSTSAEPTTWTHYVITGTENLSASTTSATVYRNGSQIWTGTISAVMGTFTADYKPWVIGRKWGSTGDYFKGEIDNFRFYARILNEAAVKALYRSEFSGVRYCNTDQNSAGCTVVNNTVYDLSQYSWLIASGTGFNGIPIYLPVSQTSIESIKVSDGWEAYLCTQANHQGSCYFYEDNFRTLNSTLTNNVYSITVQPSSFSAAKKFYGYKRADGSGNYPTGFAYLYEPVNFAAPSKTNYTRRRLFLNSYDRYNFSNSLQNTIVRTNYVGSAELYGDVYLEVGNSTYGSKELMTSHNDFSKDLSDYPELDFRNYYHNTNSAVLHGKTEMVGSVGWFVANDILVASNFLSLCQNGIAETLDDNATRIECAEYNTETLILNINVTQNPNEFWNITYNGNKQKLERYADNYSLLMLSGHGGYDSSEGIDYAIAYKNDGGDFYIHIDGEDPYSYNLGKQYTRWMETTACNSMGKLELSWAGVGNFYYDILTRLNGIGGFRNNAWWLPMHHQFDTHWEYLTHSNKTVSKAWIDSWSTSPNPGLERDARYLTLEACSCVTEYCFSFMKHDYFYNVLTGPMSQKSDLTNFNYYCFRDREDNYNNYSRGSSSTSQNYPEEFTAYSYDILPNQVVEQLFDIKIDENTAKFRGNNRYNYKDDYVILTRKDKNISAVMNRGMVSFEDEEESEKTIWDKFSEAKETAETLTLIELEYAGISRDVNEAFEVGGNGESLGKMINSVIFVFRPVINGVPIFAESIEVEYDADGFYQLRSNVPYSISEIKRGYVKSEEQVEEEIYSALGKEEEKIIAYVLNEDGEFILSAVAKDDTNKTFLTISLEAPHD